MSLRWDSIIPFHSWILLLSEQAWNSCFWISVLTSARFCSFCLSKRILILSFSISRLDFPFWHELSSCTGLSVLVCAKKGPSWQPTFFTRVISLSQKDNAFPMLSLSSSASNENESSVSMSRFILKNDFRSLWAVEVVNEFGLISGMSVYRHVATLLICRSRSGYFPRGDDMEGGGVQVREQVQVERDEVKQRRETLRKTERRSNKEQTIKRSSWMTWKWNDARIQTLEPCSEHAHLLWGVNCVTKMTCEVYLSTSVRKCEQVQLSSNKQMLVSGNCQNEDPKSAVFDGLPTILWKYSLTWDDCISRWRSGLASRIQGCVWRLTFTRYVRWYVFRYVKNPRIEPSWTRWRREVLIFDLWGSKSRQWSPSPFKRSTQCYYCPQGCGRSAGWKYRRLKMNERKKK